MVVCTRDGAWRGARAAVPVCVSVFLVGATYSIVARAAGLDAAEASWMSVWVYGSAAQLAALDVWADPLPVAAVLLTTAAVSARNLLYGASIRRYLHGLAPSRLWPTLVLLNDANWALALSDWRDRQVDAGFLLGSGAAMFVGWQSGTQVGLWFGTTIGDPATFGLDVLVVGYFAALLPGALSGRPLPAAWTAAAGAAVLVHMVSPLPLHVVAGAVAGSLAGALLDKRSPS